MRQGPVNQIGEDLLHLGVAAVVLLSLEGGERGVGEDGVVTPGGKQFVLAPGGLGLRSLTRRTISRAVIAWPFFEVNAVYSASATCASETQARSWSS